MVQQASADSAQRSWRGRLISVISGLAIVYSCLVGIVAFVLPDFIRQQLQQALSTQSFTAQIDRLMLNPLTLGATADGISLLQDDDSRPLEIEQLRVNVSLESLILRALVLDEVAVINPALFGRMNQQREFNWQQYIEQLIQASTADSAHTGDAEVEPDSGLPRVLVRHLLLEQINLRFADDSKREPYSEQFGPVDIDVRDLSTLVRPGAPYAISASTSRTELIEWHGKIELSPLRSSGTLIISGWQLPMIWRYFKEDLAFEVAAGQTALKTNYHYDGNLTLGDGVLTVEDLLLKDRLATPAELIELPRLQLTGIEFDLDRKRVDIAAIQLDQLHVRDTLDQHGGSRLAAAFTPQAAGDAKTNSSGADPGASSAAVSSNGAIADKTSNAFSLGVDSLSIRDALVSIEHQLPEDRRVNFDIGQTNIELRGFAWPDGDIQSIALDARINDSASLLVKASGDIEPPRANFELELSSFALVDLMPYVEPYFAISLESGLFQAKVVGQVAQNGAELTSTLKGTAAVTQLLIEDVAKGEKILSGEAFKLNDVSWQSKPATLEISQVELLQAYARVVIFKDGGTNLSRLAVEHGAGDSGAESPTESTASAEPKTPRDKAAGEPLQVDIASIDFHGGTADFADFSLPRAFEAAIYDIEGTIRGVSSASGQAAVVDITGAVDRYAPVTLRGMVAPLSENLQVDLELAFRNMELTAISPYSDTYAGYDIDKGKLNADFKYVIEGTQLQAENQVVIDQLTLGSSTDSPTATSLPVVLAIALLKDKNGVIDLNLPVSGDIGDPDFHYGALIGKALVNLITKIVTSPFAALGSLIGGGDDMDYVPFEPGRSDFSAAEASKLTQLAGALNDRPQLSVSVRGTAVPMIDGAALREARLTAHLEEMNIAVPIAEHSWKPVYKQYKKTMGTSARQLAKEIAAEQELDKPALQQATRERVWQDLLAAQEISEGDFQELARARSDQVRETLVGAGVAPDRIFLLDPVIDEGDEGTPHCQLELEAG